MHTHTETNSNKSNGTGYAVISFPPNHFIPKADDYRSINMVRGQWRHSVLYRGGAKPWHVFPLAEPHADRLLNGHTGRGPVFHLIFYYGNNEREAEFVWLA